jgi:hypothetical protein
MKEVVVFIKCGCKKHYWLISKMAISFLGI